MNDFEFVKMMRARVESKRDRWDNTVRFNQHEHTRLQQMSGDRLSNPYYGTLHSFASAKHAVELAEQYVAQTIACILSQ